MAAVTVEAMVEVAVALIVAVKFNRSCNGACNGYITVAVLGNAYGVGSRLWWR